MKVTLKAARVNAGLSQKKAGERIKVSKDTIANWEKGRSFPSAEKIKDIERVYKVKYDDLIFLTHKYA